MKLFLEVRGRERGWCGEDEEKGVGINYFDQAPGKSFSYGFHFLPSFFFSTSSNSPMRVITLPHATKAQEFPIREATIEDFQETFRQNELSSKQLVKFYPKQIDKLNPMLRSVIEVNPDALQQAEEANGEKPPASQTHSSMDLVLSFLSAQATPPSLISLFYQCNSFLGHIEDVRRQVNEAVQSRHVSISALFFVIDCL
ncbi:hypothetical protein Ancab_011385 [Ancistrocladus abbreviatus]